MFDRDLTHWYRDLFFAPLVTGAPARARTDDGTPWGVVPPDAPDRVQPQWFSGRKARARRRWERTDRP